MDIKDRIELEADRCVKCGICLPHCPTYKLYRNEGESPRGRIALIQALANDDLQSQRAEHHLSHCLTCLACENACPSSVKYGKLINLHREQQTVKHDQKLAVGLSLLCKLPYSKATYPLYWAYRLFGIRPLARLLMGRRFRRLDNLLPLNAGPARITSRAITTEKKLRVGLFTGCVARITDRKPLQATIKVLNRLGVEVILPKEQNCCGALHHHKGQPKVAEQLAKANNHAFNEQTIDTIVYIASGCGAQLVKSSAFDMPVMEICQFLNQLDWPPNRTLAPYSGSALLHTPCTLKNHLGLEQETEVLLNKIPDIHLKKPPHSDCCGAAGSLLIEQPELSDRLREPILKALTKNPTDLLLTSNSGCMMHLRAGISGAQLQTETIHPVELIERQLL
ncbi:MAG: (Fe-S)-binding protein [Aestuariibacter sp.]|nr:(Fe-S)-binding protein [Aestuariibacter sp.]